MYGINTSVGTIRARYDRTSFNDRVYQDIDLMKEGCRCDNGRTTDTCPIHPRKSVSGLAGGLTVEDVKAAIQSYVDILKRAEAAGLRSEVWEEATRFGIGNDCEMMLRKIDNYPGGGPLQADMQPEAAALVAKIQTFRQLADKIIPSSINPWVVGGVLLGGLAIAAGLTFLFKMVETAGVGAGTRVFTPRIKIEH